jgi:glycosyltransferase involved in cell wall biosynthesis
LFSFRRFDRVVVLSRFYTDLLVKKGVQEQRIVRISSAWCGSVEEQDKDVNMRRDNKRDAFFIGMLGRFSSEKNHVMLVRAAEQVCEKNSDVNFILAGEGALRDEIEQAVHDAGMRDHFEFWSYTGPRDFFDTVDVLVVCSRIENQPYSIMEAMDHGVPVIGTRVGGIPELLAEGRAGMLIDLDDHKALASAILRLKNDPVMCSELVEEALKRLAENYAPQTMVNQYWALYRDVMRKEQGVRECE